MKIQKQSGRLRNPLYDHPLMRKGGVHEKTNKTKRKGEKQKLRKAWCSLMALLSVVSKNTRQKTGSLSWEALGCRPKN